MSSTKNSPYAIDYHGLPLWIGHEHAASGAISKISVSCRVTVDGALRRGQRRHKTICEHRYRLPAKAPIFDDDPDLPALITQVLDKRVPTTILPELLTPRDGNPPALSISADMSAALVLPYLLAQNHTCTSPSPETRKDHEFGLATLLSKFGSWPIGDITPANCGPTLTAMSRSTAKRCLTVLRLVWSTALANIVADPTVWSRYSLHGHSNYSPTAAIRHNLLPAVLDESQCREIMTRCDTGIVHPLYGGRYLMAAIMLVTGISSAMACAVTHECIYRLSDYPYYLGVRIDHEVIPVINTEKSSATRTKHRITDITEPHQAGPRALGTWINTLWEQYCGSHSDVIPTDRIAKNVKNRNRILSPENFDAWLETAFGATLYERIISGPRDVADNHSVADYLRGTAIDRLRWAGYSSEELLRQQGRAPQHTDGQYYIAFAHESELATMANYQDLWVRNTHPTPYLPSLPAKSRKYFSAVGRPLHRTLAILTLTFPPNVLFEDVLCLLSAQQGLRATINSTFAPKGGET